MGVVHIDLEIPPMRQPKPGMTMESNPKLMHVTRRPAEGWCIWRSWACAATSQYIEFQAGGMTGHATGADYSSDSGMLMLHSAVSTRRCVGRTSGESDGGDAAEFNDQTQQAHMTRASFDSQGRTAVGDDVTLYRRQDGTLSRVEAHGNVTGEANGATVVAQRADVALTATSQPQTAVLTGGVRYSADEPLRQIKGESDAATIAFDGKAKPQPSHALFTGAVHVTERTRTTDAAKRVEHAGFDRGAAGCCAGARSERPGTSAGCNGDRQFAPDAREQWDERD